MFYVVSISSSIFLNILKIHCLVVVKKQYFLAMFFVFVLLTKQKKPHKKSNVAQQFVIVYVKKKTIFFGPPSKKNFWPPKRKRKIIVLVLLSAMVKRFSVSCVRDFYLEYFYCISNICTQFFLQEFRKSPNASVKLSKSSIFKKKFKPYCLSAQFYQKKYKGFAVTVEVDTLF